MLLTTQQRQRYLLQTGVFAAAGALLSRQLAAAQLAPPLLPGLLLLTAIMAAALVVSGLAARRAVSVRSAFIYRSAVVLAFGGALYWAGQHARLLRLATLSARLEMYADAARLFRITPWLGQGGDTWRSSYLHIQRSPYVGSEVHSGYIDLALDLGIIGLSIVVCWLSVIIIMMFRRRSVGLAPLTVLLIHSLVDFDMSYGLFWLLVLWLAGLGLSYSRREALNQVKCIQAPSKTKPAVKTQYRTIMYGITMSTKTMYDRIMYRIIMLTKTMYEKIKYMMIMLTKTMCEKIMHRKTIKIFYRTIINKTTLYGVMAFVFCTASIFSFRAAEGLRLYQAAHSVQELDPVKAEQLFRKSLSLDPSRSDSRIALAALSSPEMAISVLNQGIVYDRRDYDLWLGLGSALASKGDIHAVAAFRQAISLNRFNRSLQTEVLHKVTILAHELKSKQRYEEARTAAFAGYQMYNEYRQLSEAIRLSPGLRNDRDFTLTREAAIRGRELRRLYLASSQLVPQQRIFNSLASYAE
ncbi:O-Antigen ligase [compost metagenome]